MTPAIERKPVVFLDDNRSFRDTLEDTARGFGIEPIVCGDMNAVVEFMSQYPGAAFVSDIRMPGVSGIDALGEVKERFPKAETYAISSFDPTSDETRSLRVMDVDLFDKRHAIIELMEHLGGQVRPQDVESEPGEMTTIGVDLGTSTTAVALQGPSEPESQKSTEFDPELAKRNVERLQEYELLKSLNRDFIDLLLKDLNSLPDQTLEMADEDGSFTIAELRDDLLNQTPRGRRYVEKWRDAMATLNEVRSPNPAATFKSVALNLWHNVTRK